MLFTKILDFKVGYTRPIFIPRALLSLERAIAQPSLLLRIMTSLPSSLGLRLFHKKHKSYCSQPELLAWRISIKIVTRTKIGLPV
ncbi:MAG: hypothetical protein QG673_952 [Pseudomonadota bacterium]|nr:hypothetical protein [Pseudomonadota bacterium]